MKFLITAGNTLVPIDQVRGITNIFSGRTGTQIALHAYQQGHEIILLTSKPEVVHQFQPYPESLSNRWKLAEFQTFEDLHKRMKDCILQHSPDVIVHSAAVSDYQPVGIYSPAKATAFDEQHMEWKSESSSPPSLIDVQGGKVKSSNPELWLRLVPTPKLVDLIRSEWRFQGILVKFKLEVGIDAKQLLEIAEDSRRQSQADIIVANTLEEAKKWAYIGSGNRECQKITREDLPKRLLEEIRTIAAEGCSG